LPLAASSAQISSPKLTVARKRKLKEKAPNTVDSVRRSSRLAKLKGGFKNGMPEQTCELDDSDEEENIFHAQVLNTEAPPPPHLPLELLQALGTGERAFSHMCGFGN
jgi:hypothetical protein